MNNNCSYTPGQVSRIIIVPADFSIIHTPNGWMTSVGSDKMHELAELPTISFGGRIVVYRYAPIPQPTPGRLFRFLQSIFNHK